MARPRKATHERKSRQIIFRLTEEEYAQICAHAKQAGMPPNELARLLTKCVHKRVVIKTYPHLDPAYIAQIKRIGQNLNTLTKNAHIFKRVSPKVEALCNEIREIIENAANERIPQ